MRFKNSINLLLMALLCFIPFNLNVEASPINVKQEELNKELNEEEQLTEEENIGENETPEEQSETEKSELEEVHNDDIDEDTNEPSEIEESESMSTEEESEEEVNESEDGALEIETFSISEPEPNLPYGINDSDEYIKEIKRMLNAIGFGGISITPKFGGWTETRVKQFQENYELSVTGVVDENTLEKLMEVFNSPFQKGNTHDDIQALKEKLNRMDFGYITVTSLYGDFTVKKVKEFQRFVGMKDNGIADALTRQKLNELVENGFKQGDRHRAMIDLKKNLNSIGFGGITVTEYYGSFTERRVKEFQKAYGLPETGRADKVTLDKIDEVKSNIKDMKSKLNAIGFDRIAVTSNVGNWTKTRIKQFQENYELNVTGVADLATIEKLDEVYHSPFQKNKRNDQIIDLKEKLNTMGFGYISISTLYGSYTEKKVKDFQRFVGMKDNGIADALTRKKLDELVKNGYHQGDSHSNLETFKEKLNAIGFNRIAVTPNYGNWTKTRVKQFQENYGLNVTGNLDAVTLEKLDEIYNSPFQKGKRHDDIPALKEKLNLMGFGYITVTTLYGDYTAKKVKDFQRFVGMKDNGIADKLTIQKLDELVESGYKQGDRHSNLKDFKRDLNRLDFGYITVTDYFGSFSEKKVKEFQNYYGLTDTGRLNGETLQKLNDIVNSPFQEGKRHDDTIQLKERLNNLGFGYITISTLYGNFTERQVKAFQEYYGLKAHGIADDITLAKIDEILDSPFQNGKRHDDTVQLKEKLNRLGFGYITISTLYGDFTKQKVEEFQDYYGLRVSGIADEITRAKIDEVLDSPLQLGRSHHNVSLLKEDLNKLGYEIGNSSDEYDSETEAAVEAFQEDYNLPVSGIADEVTLETITEAIAAREVIKYTQYQLSLSDAIDMQMKVKPQTDKYRNDPAYVSAKYVDVYGSITGSYVNLRTSPNLGDKYVQTAVSNGTTFTVLDDNVKGDTVSGSVRWYKIKYNGDILYVHSSLAKVYGETTVNVNVRDKASSKNGHVYGIAKKGTRVTILEMGNSWHKISYSTWRNAKRSDVKQYLDPTNFVDDEVERFQFLDLSKPSGVSVDVLNNYLKGKGVLAGKGASYIQAGQQHGVNDLYLLSHSLLETGNGTSELASGIEVGKDSKGNPTLVTSKNRNTLTDIETVYNVYGVGAYDDCPEECGAKKAYVEKWFSVEKAIVGGAAFIGNDYIKAGQNTLYEMRWNPQAMVSKGKADHQYATDIGWASKQITTMYNLYQLLDNYILQLDIPKYK